MSGATQTTKPEAKPNPLAEAFRKGATKPEVGEAMQRGARAANGALTAAKDAAAELLASTPAELAKNLEDAQKELATANAMDASNAAAKEAAIKAAQEKVKAAQEAKTKAEEVAKKKADEKAAAEKKEEEKKKEQKKGEEAKKEEKGDKDKADNRTLLEKSVNPIAGVVIALLTFFVGSSIIKSMPWLEGTAGTVISGMLAVAAGFAGSTKLGGWISEKFGLGTGDAAKKEAEAPARARTRTVSFTREDITKYASAGKFRVVEKDGVPVLEANPDGKELKGTMTLAAIDEEIARCGATPDCNRITFTSRGNGEISYTAPLPPRAPSSGQARS